MSKIKSFGGRNISGRTFRHDLGRVTAFVGKNRVGKTTRANALLLALYGYVPGVPRQTAKVFEAFATSDTMEASALLDDGRVIGRAWRKRRDSVTLASSEEAEALSLPAVMIDANEYFALSANDRVRFLFEVASLPESLTVEAMRASIVKNAKNIKLETNTDRSERAIAEVVEFVGKFRIEPEPVQQWLAALVEEARLRKNNAAQNVKRLEATSAGQAQTASDAPAAPPDADEKLTQARKDLEAAVARETMLTQEVTELQRQWTELKPAAAGAVDVAALNERLRLLGVERIKHAAVGQPEDEKSAPRVSTPEIDARLNNLSTEKTRLFALAGKPRPDGAPAGKLALDAGERWRNAQVGLRIANADVDRLATELAATIEERCCSKCGQNVEELKRPMIASLELALGAARAKQALAVTEEAEAKGEKARLDLAHQKIHEEQQGIDQAKAAFQRVSQEHADEQAKVNTMTREAWQSRQNDYLVAQQALARISEEESGIRVLLGAASTANAAAAKAKEDQARIEADGRAKKLEVDAAKEDVRTKRSGVESWEIYASTLAAERQAAKAQATVVAEAEAIRAGAEVLKQFHDMLLALQVELMTAAIGPIVADMNRFCGDLFDAPLSYRDGAFGMLRETGFVTYATFSGSEKALSYCALSLALAARAEIKLAVLDEMGRLDAASKAFMFRRLEALTLAGAIDNAVLLDTDASAYHAFADGSVSESFRVIEI